MAQRHTHRPVLESLTAYARREQDDELVIPDNLEELSDEDLAALEEQATNAFDAIYGDGSNVSEDDLAQMQAIEEGLSDIHAVQNSRAEAQAERSNRAAELASRIRPQDSADDEAGDDHADDESEDAQDAENGQDGDESGDESGAEVTALDDHREVDAESGDQAGDQEQEQIAASARRRTQRINLSSVRSRQGRTPSPRSGSQPTTMRDLVMAAPDVPGFANGQGMDWNDMGRAVDSRLTTFQPTQYARARAAGKHLRQQYGVAVFRKPFEDDLRIDSNDPDAVDRVFNRAVDQTRLPGGSLTASGGWCAPSETLYDLFELETNVGIFSLPEVNISRGGIRYTVGPDFSELFQEITGFHYTEEQDEAGNYGVDANGVGNGTAGSKPCYKVPCVDFEEQRLDLDGLCITAGLLESRGYPELIARYIRGAMVAHANRIAARKLSAIQNGSTAVAFAAGQVGATAPILTAIELQVEHYRQVHRMNRATVLEAVFPYWIKGAVRTDLSRRLGDETDLFSVTDAMINGWFTQRGVNPQFVYNLQDLTTDAAGTIVWPDSVKFLLYAAGTWVGGSSDVITLDTLYDSTLLGENDYTALFTEEGYLVAKRGFDSRVVTVPINPNGSTGAGLLLNADGTENVAPAA